MTNLIPQLVEASYKNGELDAATVEKIAAKLTRRELKAYIRGLKEQEKRTTVIVETSGKTDSAATKELEAIFAGKKIQVMSNPDLLLGLRITDNDDVYNMNLKNDLERIAAYATE